MFPLVCKYFIRDFKKKFIMWPFSTFFNFFVCQMPDFRKHWIDIQHILYALNINVPLGVEVVKQFEWAHNVHMLVIFSSFFIVQSHVCVTAGWKLI